MYSYNCNPELIVFSKLIYIFFQHRELDLGQTNTSRGSIQTIWIISHDPVPLLVQKNSPLFRYLDGAVVKMSKYFRGASLSLVILKIGARMGVGRGRKDTIAVYNNYDLK